eukprot:3771530-Alexandrium_andersonii.AAC.1
MTGRFAPQVLHPGALAVRRRSLLLVALPHSPIRRMARRALLRWKGVLARGALAHRPRRRRALLRADPFGCGPGSSLAP